MSDTATTEPALFELEEDDGLFLLLPPGELQKVKGYTASSLRKWERLREAVSMLLPWWPLDEIAKHLHVSEKTLREFARRESEKVALSGKELGAVCRSAAARALFIAKSKESGATYPQLMLGAKLMIDAAGQLEQTGLVGEEKVVKEDRARMDGLARLRAMRDAIDAEIVESQRKADASSVVNPLNSNGLLLHGAEHGAVDVTATIQPGGDQVPASSVTGQDPARAGGGSGEDPPAVDPMGQQSREIYQRPSGPSDPPNAPSGDSLQKNAGGSLNTQGGQS